MPGGRSTVKPPPTYRCLKPAHAVPAGAVSLMSERATTPPVAAVGDAEQPVIAMPQTAAHWPTPRKIRRADIALSLALIEPIGRYGGIQSVTETPVPRL